MSLVAQYLFNDNAQDEIGGHNGTAYNVTYEDAPDDKNFAGKVAVFNGSTSYISLANTFNITNCSFELWVYPTRASFGDNISIVDFFNTSENPYRAWGLSQTTTANYFFTVYNFGDWHFVGMAMAPNNWYHVVFAKDSSKVYGFLNGEFKTTTDGSNISTNLSVCSRRWLGRGGNGYWQGKLARFAVHDVCLTAAEVAQNYKQQSAPPPSRHFTKFRGGEQETSATPFNKRLE